MPDHSMFEILGKWFSTGRFPRDEFQIRPSLALVGGLTLLGLATAVVLEAPIG
jgi:hypothetical protein